MEKQCGFDVENFVAKLVRKTVLVNGISCIALLTSTRELFDVYGIKFNEVKSVRIGSKVKYLQFFLDRIAAVLDCPVIFGGFLSLPLPQNKAEAEKLNGERRKRPAFARN